jgi:hypothetical protein
MVMFLGISAQERDSGLSQQNKSENRRDDEDMELLNQTEVRCRPNIETQDQEQIDLPEIQ